MQCLLANNHEFAVYLGKFSIWCCDMASKICLIFHVWLVYPHTFLFDASDLGLIKTLTLLDALCRYATHHILIAY